MRARQLSHGEHGKTFALIFEAGDEAVEELTRWCEEQQITAARVTAVGAFSEATIAWFDWEAREYRELPVAERVEVLALTGDVAQREGRPRVHVHVVLGARDGWARGGHLISARVRPTLELVLDETPSHLRKRHDRESGLALIDPRY
jgi:predicted DNA-binding protein with PD1-like motif